MTLFYMEEKRPGFPFDGESLAREVIRQALSFEAFPYEAEVSLTLTDEAGITRLNHDFRQIDSPTDVLSFPMAEYRAGGDFTGLEDQMDCFHPESGEFLLGDIVICIPRVFSQASDYGHSVRREYAFLIAHSMLHLMGYDHLEQQEAVLMEDRQEKILQALHITRNKEER